jgi:mRNA interferase MazF
MPVARRGEIWQVDLGMAAKVRPALILSVAFLDHERALFAIVPHTIALRGTRFEISLSVPGMQSGAFDAQGIRPVPAAALNRKLGVLTPDQILQVEEGVRAWLGLAR